MSSASAPRSLSTSGKQWFWAGTLVFLSFALPAEGLSGPSSPAARAASVDVTCTGALTSHFTPGLSVDVRTITVRGEGELTRCHSGDPALTSATTTYTSRGQYSCTGGSARRTYTVRWSNGRASTIETTTGYENDPKGQRLLMSKGSVTSGEFAGGTAVIIASLPVTPPVACTSSEGMSEITVPVAVTLLKP
ncbi:hypothetical protein [Allokutzneria albata]|uniref:Uncharacterized protein n=1 Tax=Allokutzneria albata TaxID=211114 RepID=A0A1G9STS5_ALLAB|nr:hypothetical protein [Allokutzneria albata]SDM38793.1 hypothetical protein SAMN04489726_1374 [Allokutzneria albata]